MNGRRLLVLGCLLLSLLGTTARPWLPWLADRPLDLASAGWCSASGTVPTQAGDDKAPATACTACAASAWALIPPPPSWLLRPDLAQAPCARPEPAHHQPQRLAVFRARAPPGGPTT